MKKYLVIPTYNESKNLEQLIDRISLLHIPDLTILVVDDNSPDGTGDVAEDLKARHGNIVVMHREKKEGLGRAYVAGFKRALWDGAELVLQMDADFSHDPKYLPKILEEVANNDVVLGSRYVRGGGTKNWGIIRRIISRCGNVYARIVLDIPIRDLTGGFKCYRGEVLQAIDLDTLGAVGYGFQIETTYRAFLLGYKIFETPIIFVEREEGESKFDLGIIYESFWKVLLLRLKKFKRGAEKNKKY